MRTLEGSKPIVQTAHFERFWLGYFWFICIPAVSWSFGVLLDDKDLFIGF